jgi:uncharacterized SAM-binding protein YcdF (DUF218 family)
LVAASRLSRRTLLLTTILLVAAAVLGAGLWLPVLGHFLVEASAPQKADMAVVLAGDYFGHRIVRGAELVRAGHVPHALVSGSPGFYGFHECDMAIPFAVKKGYPAEWFIPFPHEANSTEEEASYVIP